MVAATLTPTRALRRPRRADPRALIGVFLTLAALAGSVSFWVGSTEAHPVVVATRDLPVGATLRAGDLVVSYVRMDDNLLQAALPGEFIDSVVGRQLSEPVHTQQVLARAQVAERLGLQADQVAITIPARPDSAVDGRLRPGDGVQVLVTVVDKARAEAHARLVLERAQVFSIGRDEPLSSSSFGSADNDGFARGAINSITLAVSPAEARLLAEARRTGELDVVLLPAQPPPQASTPELSP